MKFKVGEKVRVREGLKSGTFYGSYPFSKEMVDYSGKIGTIISEATSFHYYRLDIDDGIYMWTDEMLEPAEETNVYVELKQDPISASKIAKFMQLQGEELELYKQKNAKYGDSFSISVQKYGLISALTRMSDKWNRIENLILNHDNGTDDESLIDSLRDLSNYANMTIIELEEVKWN